jgi:hypothetical protein
MSVITVNTSVADLAYEVLMLTWRPLPIPRLLASIKELCGIDVSKSTLRRQLIHDSRFTLSLSGFGLDEYRWRVPGRFFVS